MAKVIKLHPQNPHSRAINQIVDILKNDGLIIYPSDTVYAIGCDASSQKAMEKLARFKGVKLEKAMFSIVCNDLSHLSQFSRPISTTYFRLLKSHLPGAFTFILPASKDLPAGFRGRKTIGIRVPDHQVPQLIVEELGVPISSTSIHNSDEILQYMTDPEEIAEFFDKQVDLVVDSGAGGNQASTIVDLTTDEPIIIRQGKAELEF